MKQVVRVVVLYCCYYCWILNGDDCYRTTRERKSIIWLVMGMKSVDILSIEERGGEAMVVVMGEGGGGNEKYYV